MRRWLALALSLAWLSGQIALAAVNTTFAASSTKPGSSANGAGNSDRFAKERGPAWQGESGRSNWWWQASFAEPRELGAILQIQGDHDFVLRNAPRDYFWQVSDDGVAWRDLRETKVTSEQRSFRLHRLGKAIRTRHVRLLIGSATGETPVLREVEFFASPRARVDFPDWVVVVNATQDGRLPGHGKEFIPLARASRGGANLQAQQVGISQFDEAFINVEPRPLCAFLSGTFKDWCEVEREAWRGAQRILKRRALPMWASCGGAQGLAILSETGVDRPWDCPHCRDTKHPKLPIYTHIGHTATRPCGDYTGCVFERGPHFVKQIKSDPVFVGLPGEFSVMESHCGQIEWPPAGWELIATAGEGTTTKTQCLKIKGHPVYAAQFHIEMDGTPENSRIIMGDFLEEARKWNGKRR